MYNVFVPYKLRLHYIYTSQDDKITSVCLLQLWDWPVGDVDLDDGAVDDDGGGWQVAGRCGRLETVDDGYGAMSLGHDALADSAYAASTTLTRLKADLEASETQRRQLRAELTDLRSNATGAADSQARQQEDARALHADLCDRESDLMKLRGLLESRDEGMQTATATLRKKDERIAQLRDAARAAEREAFGKLESAQTDLRAEQQKASAAAAERDGAVAEALAARSDALRMQSEQSALAGGEMVVVEAMAAELQTVQQARQQAQDTLHAAQCELQAATTARSEETAVWEREKRELEDRLAEQRAAAAAPPPPPAATPSSPAAEDPAKKEWSKRARNPHHNLISGVIPESLLWL